MAKICPYCKKAEYEEGDSYCEKCGNRLPPKNVSEGIWDPRRAKTRDNGWVIALLYGVSSIGVVGGIGYLVYLLQSDRLPNLGHVVNMAFRALPH